MCLRLWSQVFPRPGFTSSHLDRSIPLTRLGVVPATETETQLEVAATDGGLFLSFETKFKGESYAADTTKVSGTRASPVFLVHPLVHWPPSSW